ncbi:MAG: O-antigen ligase family protein [Thermoanaerobaculia bacterium]
MGSDAISVSSRAAVASTAGDRSDSERFGFVAFAFHLWAVVALALSNILLLLSIAAVPIALRRRLPQELARLEPYRGLLGAVGFYVLAGLVSVAASLDPRASLGKADELLGLVTLLLAIVWVRNERQVRWILDGIVVVATLSAIWGLGQFLAGYGDLGQRIRGPFSHYMTFAGVLLLADLVLVARFACRKPRPGDWRWAACALITIALLGSLTRSSWVALALTLLVAVLMRRPRSLLVWVPAALVVLSLFVAPVRQRALSIVDLQDPSNYDRLSMLDAGIDMLEERPFFGLGPGMAERLYPIYRPLAAPRHTVPHLHNTYLHLAADTGLVGLAAYLLLIGSGIVVAYRGYRAAHEYHRDRASREDLYLASFLGLVGFGIAGLFEANWLDTEVQRPILFLLTVPFILRAADDAEPTTAPGVGE